MRWRLKASSIEAAVCFELVKNQTTFSISADLALHFGRSFAIDEKP
jgi:hypothetical protein